MTSTTQKQLRDINQQSVELSPEWVERLKQVQVVAQNHNQKELPEIVLVSVPHAKLSSSDTQSQTVPRAHIDQNATTDEQENPQLENSQTDTSAVDSFAFETVDTLTTHEEDSSSVLAEHDSSSGIDIVGFLSNYMDVSDLEIPASAPAERLETSDTDSPKVDLTEIAEIDSLHSTPINESIDEPSDDPTEEPVNEEAMAVAESTANESNPDPSPIEAEFTAATGFVPAHKIAFDIEKLKMDERVTNLRINRMIDRILEKIPPVEPTSIVFGDSHPIPDTAFVTAQAAVGLVKRDLGPVLIIEADIQLKMLSNQFCPNEQAGLAEILENETPWQELVHATSLGGLDFLPLGISEIAKPNINGNACRQLLAKLKRHYRNICICAGSFQPKMATTMATACDATYLVVDISTSDQQEVGQTCKTLHDCGARALGCIAAEPR